MTDKETAITLQRLTDTLKNGLDNVANRINKLDKTISNHKGRLKKMEEWKLKIEGGKSVLKGIWGAVGGLVISAVVGIFFMYIQIRELSQTIQMLEKQERNYVDQRISQTEIRLMEKVASYYEEIK